MSENEQYVFVSDGTHLPAGQYLVTVWGEDEGVELAWRPKPDTRIVWSPPVYGDEQ